MNEKLLGNVRFYFAQSVFNSNCHFKAMGRFKKYEKRFSRIIISVSSITIISLILQIVGFENSFQILRIVAVYIGLFATAGSLICERFNKSDRIQKIFQHNMYAEKYKSLRDEYMSLIEEIMSNFIPEDQIRVKRDNLQKRYSDLGENAPNIAVVDYEQARIGLGIFKNNKEEFTWSDSEINKFLPKELHV